MDTRPVEKARTADGSSGSLDGETCAGPRAVRRRHGLRPRIVIWEMTRACPLKCVHCRAEAHPWRHPLELSTVEAEELIDRVVSFGEPLPVFVFSGGDPLQRPDLVPLIRCATGRGLRVGVTPAPTARLDRRTIAEIQNAGAHRMALSLDGSTAELHDAFRGEAGSFDAVVRAARIAEEVDLPIQINTTVARSTAADLPAIADRVEELGAVMWEVFFLVPVGRGSALEPLSAEETEETLRWLYLRQRSAPFHAITVEAPAYRRVGREVERELRDAGGATARSGDGALQTPSRPEGSTGDANGFVFISHLGDVYPSGFLPLAVGNVRKRDLVDLYRQHPVFRQLRDPDRLEGKCGVCPYRYLCGGSRARAYAVTGNPMASDPFCVFDPEEAAGSRLTT